MKKNFCIDCKVDISHRRWNAKRCRTCQIEHHLSNMKRYRNAHKKEIREYQKVYYSKEENKQ